MPTDSAAPKTLLPGTLLEMTPEVLGTYYGVEIRAANPDFKTQTYRDLLDAAKVVRFAFEIEGQRIWFEAHGESPAATEPAFQDAEGVAGLARIRAELGERFRLVLRS